MRTRGVGRFAERLYRVAPGVEVDGLDGSLSPTVTLNAMSAAAASGAPENQDAREAR